MCQHGGGEAAESTKDGRTQRLSMCLARSALQPQHAGASSCYVGAAKQQGFLALNGSTGCTAPRAAASSLVRDDWLAAVSLGAKEARSLGLTHRHIR